MKKQSKLEREFSNLIHAIRTLTKDLEAENKKMEPKKTPKKCWTCREGKVKERVNVDTRTIIDWYGCSFCKKPHKNDTCGKWRRKNGKH